MQNTSFAATKPYEGNDPDHDDEEPLRRLLSRIIGLEGFATLKLPSLKSAWKELEKQPDVVLCDVKLPDGNGVDFVRSARASFPLYRIYSAYSLRKYSRWCAGHQNGGLRLHHHQGRDNDRIIPLVHQAIKSHTGRKSNHPGTRKVSTHFEDIGGNKPADQTGG